MKKLAFILATVLIFCCLGCAQTGIAFAASETIYTGVLEDLQRDEAFDIEQVAKAAENAGNKEMYVFQIAESNAGELFLYVYQQSEGKFTASEVRISQTIGDNLAPKDYKLTLLDRSGALVKYKVEELHINTVFIRYYLIVQIARPYNKDCDGVGVPGATITGATQNGNIINTVVYSVESLFTVETKDNTVVYSEEHADCIEIISKYVGNLRYYNGGTWGQEYYSSLHYVAFSTEIPISEIYEVDIKYVVTDYFHVDDYAYKRWCDENFNKSFYHDRDKEPIVEQKTLTSKQYTSYKNAWDYLLHKAHTWDTIQSKDTFVASENLDPSVSSQLDDKQWVLRFATTDIKKSNLGLGGEVYSFSEVSDVTLLRLNFLSKGIVYNLGVVDNKQTGGSVTKPDNPTDNPENPLDGFKALLKQMEEFWDKVVNAFNWLVEHWWVIIVCLIGVGLLIALIVAIVKFGAKVVFKAIGKVLLLILKLVLLPFTLLYYGIKALVKRSKENG